MDNPEYGEPLFGFLEDFEEQMAELQNENFELRRRVEQLNGRLQRADKDVSKLREKLKDSDERRKSERERLCAWLDRRIAQQEEAMGLSCVSKETKRIMEIEVSILRRYRGIVVESSHTKGDDDPLMPRPF